jgi:hypothetical protein
MSGVLVLFASLAIAADPARNAEETTLDKRQMVSVFAGDWRVKWTRSEVLLDIDPNPPGTAGAMKARTRLVLTPFTAKRLAGALATTYLRHEDTFGAVEVPPTKEVKDEGKLDPNLAVVYSNFCRVIATPEEVFLDFGLNDNPFDAAPKSLPVERRVILTLAPCKVLLRDLAAALASYESKFGHIELDVRKRAKQKTEP